jgi:hypothetical protein
MPNTIRSVCELLPRLLWCAFIIVVFLVAHVIFLAAHWDVVRSPSSPHDPDRGFWADFRWNAEEDMGQEDLDDYEKRLAWMQEKLTAVKEVGRATSAARYVLLARQLKHRLGNPFGCMLRHFKCG